MYSPKQAKQNTEKASKLGHIEVIQSPLVKKLCENFEDASFDLVPSTTKWQPLPAPGQESKLIFASDSAIKTIETPQPPHKKIAFVKAALLKLDQYAINKLDKDNPNPFAIRDLMKESALFHSTAFPLQHVAIPGKNIFHGVREIIYESIKDEGFNNALGGNDGDP
jgi:hypothetical protein